MPRVTITPDPFTLVPYDGAAIIALVEDVAAMVDFPPGVEIHVDVDEELFAPLTGHMADVVDGRAELWISGAGGDSARVKVFIDTLPQVVEQEGAVTEAALPVSFWGTLLVRGPYGRRFPFNLLYARPYAARGYHVVFVSSRGTAD